MKHSVSAPALALVGLAVGYAIGTRDADVAQAGVEPPATFALGDANADGELSVSDAVFILRYLFRAGDAPPQVPCPDGGEGVRGVLVTGQTTCYSGTRGDPQIPCPRPGEPDYGQDPNFDTGVARDFELVKPDEEDRSTWVTIDHATGLMWQYTSERVVRNWRDALAAVEELELGGYSDWRMPNVRELYSIVDIGQSPDTPAVDRSFFALQPVVYWSSSSCVSDTSRAWTVRFNEGLVACLDKGGQAQGSNRFLTLAVRSLE
jgi:hypothetical protein